MAETRPLLASQRQQRILQQLRSSGAVRVQDLTSLLHVSDMTVRRDLNELSERGLAEKVHGGAILTSRLTSDEPTFASKSSREQTEKETIASTAATLVSPGSAIALSAGTTTWAMARALMDVPDLTIVTNSIRIADVFHEAAGRERRGRHAQSVILKGGVRTPSEALVGPVAERAIRSLNVDMLFIGCHGLDAEAGLSTPNMAESETNKQFIRSARQVVLTADHTKWGVVGLSSFADLRDVDTWVTDTGLDQATASAATELVGQVIVADSAVPGSALPATASADA